MGFFFEAMSYLREQPKMRSKNHAREIPQQHINSFVRFAEAEHTKVTAEPIIL
jgi:hypothetical protein